MFVVIIVVIQLIIIESGTIHPLQEGQISIKSSAWGGHQKQHTVMVPCTMDLTVRLMMMVVK